MPTKTFTVEYSSTYQIEAGDDGVLAAALRTREPYEAKLLYHIQRQGYKGMAVDVGANVGNHTLWLTLVCGLDTLAFEPVEFDVLRKNLELNGISVMQRAWHVALGASYGEATYLGDGKLAIAKDGPIVVRPLDEYLPLLHDLAMVKVDVEGMELDVLRGAERTIDQWHPALYVEVSDEEAQQALAAHLEPLGYEHMNTFGATPLEEWLPC